MTPTPPPRRRAPTPQRRPARTRRRGIPREVWIGLAVGLLVVAAGALVLTLGGDDDPSEGSATSPDTWRLGYAGFGPIALGMTLDEASKAAGLAVTEPSQCPGSAHGEGLPGLSITHDGDRIVSIGTNQPGIRTVSGAEVGTTEADLLAIYPHARAASGQHSAPILRITNPSGRLVDFYMQGENGTVSAMLVAGSETDARAVPSCD